MVPPAKPILGSVMKRLKDFAYDRFRSQFPPSPATIMPVTYDVVYPQEVSEVNTVPSHIAVPSYILDEEEELPIKPTIKTAKEIELMRSSCRLAKKMLNAAKKQIKVGMTTDELDKYVHDLIVKNEAYPSPLRYNGFPKSICTSVNNVVCHGIPDSRPLRNGDIISVDVTVYHQGYHGDCAATFLVGDVDDEGQYLVQRAEEILMKTISVCKPGRSMETIGRTITALASKAQLQVIPSVFGHGIGRYFHEMPSVDHCIKLENATVGHYDGTQMIDEDPDECEEIMIPGMTFTIEPVFGTGTQETELLEDGWTLITVDNSRTAQFEHTILITNTGAEILTK